MEDEERKEIERKAQEWKEHVELLKQSEQEERSKQEEFYQKIKQSTNRNQILKLPYFDKGSPVTIFERCFYQAFDKEKDPETAKHLLNIFRDDLKESSMGKYILVKSTMRLIDYPLGYPEIFISPTTVEKKRKKFLVVDNKQVEKIYNRSQEDNPVMIVGERGTGKGLLAKLIHELSPRRDQKFEATNCATILEGLLESELFGHEQGAFTGAIKKKKGILEIANKGTVFLDELGRMPDHLQGELLKAVEEKEIRHLGSEETIKIDVRYICAGQPEHVRNIIKDLQDRLGFSDFIELPTLEQELKGGQEKCEYLIKYSLNRAKRSLNFDKDIQINESIYSLLLNLKYPGNFRQFESILQSAIRSMNDNRRTQIKYKDLLKGYRKSTMFYKDKETSLSPDTDNLKNIKLKDLLNHADKIKASIIDAKIKSEMQRTGLDLKSLCEKEGIEYYNFRKKVVKITGKGIKEFGIK